MRDAVDDFLDQWAAQRTDLDLEAMGAIGRILRLARLTSGSLKTYFAEHDMETWEFDVLATLRRNNGALTPKELAASVMITSAALTNRIDRLAARGLVTREAVPGNRRSLHIALTEQGRALVDGTIEGHVRNQQKILSGLTREERTEFNSLLRTLLASLGDTRDAPPHP